MYVDTSASTRICLNAANADTATKLAEAKTIEITGAVTGLVKFDGSADVNIATDLSQHRHKMSDLIGVREENPTTETLIENLTVTSSNAAYGKIVISNINLNNYAVGDSVYLQIDTTTAGSGDIVYNSTIGGNQAQVLTYKIYSGAVDGFITIEPAPPIGSKITLKIIQRKYYWPIDKLDPKVVQRSELDTYSFITTDDIDTICGQSIVAASEVTF